MREIHFLTVEDVCDIQKDTLYGAPSSDIGKVEGAVYRVFNAHHYEGVTDLIELAAMYLIAIAGDHAFPDANKRTGFKSASTFLDMNGIVLTNSDELVELTVRVATHQIDRSELAQQLRRFVSLTQDT